MRIAIIGTRGIPNHYGGFEQCAEYLAVGLKQRGYDVIVYNSHNHPYQQTNWQGIEIVHCYDPEYKWGTAGQFVYDLNCIKDVRKRDCDIILQLGYTSSSVWGWLLPKNVVVTTNMDGLEWKRTKFSGKVRSFLLYAEKLGVKYSDHLISDSIGIQDYILDKYGKESTYIPYGADLFYENNAALLKDYDVSEYNYDMLIARLEPENSIEIILDGVVKSNLKRTFLVIGNHQTKYGEVLKSKYKQHVHIRFVGGVYNMELLNNLRHYSHLYFHGHTVGGTNPSLLEAMASSSLICANDNAFNKYILNEDAYYFENADDVANHIINVDHNDLRSKQMIAHNREKIEKVYTWSEIVDQYAAHFEMIKGAVTR